jgi:hypothetical protein
MQTMMDQTQKESVEHFKYFRSITNYAREIKYSIVMAKAAFKKTTLFTNKFDLRLRKKLVK